ncbi:hypothetical protein GDO81_003707 [Engystomops pustulosus]|uniref:Uncharacterized protein n=1 Tax=Engystomops pustulosus TaxID=76066 RepID=A0AAV6ZYJ4_ENGPU|nr:hypothetical protein GDO81_003707 [Engystomops pustulosus]
MSLDFCCDIRMVGSEFGVNNMKVWIHPALYQRFRLVVVVSWCGEYFLGTLWAPCTQHLMATFSRIMRHVITLESSQTGFLNMTMSSLYSNGLHSHQISIQ